MSGTIFSRYALLLLLPVGLAFSACIKRSKPVDTASARQLTSPEKGRINKSVWTSPNVGYICGGEKDRSGFIYRTNDAGASWIKVFTSDSKSLYDIYFVNDTIAYSCGDKLLLLKSRDNGLTWLELAYTFTPQAYNIAPLRCIFGNYRFLMMIGGENYDTGNALWFESDQQRWAWHFDHEFRAGLNFTPENFVLCGYGASFSTNDHGYTYKTLPFKGDYFTGASTVSDSIGYVCGYNGGIYKTTDAGTSWKKLIDIDKLGHKRKRFNGICFMDAKNGLVIGNEGKLMRTTDGTNWQDLQPFCEDDLLSITTNKNGEYVITTSKGGITILHP